MADSGPKTEKATPKKRRDQRKEGNVLQSKDVARLVTFAGSFFALSIFLEGMIVSIAQFMIRFLGIAGTMTDTSNGNVVTLSSLFAVTLAAVPAGLRTFGYSRQRHADALPVCD